MKNGPSRNFVIATFVVLVVICLVRLSSFGIWDPWELSAADLARQLAVGDAVEVERPILQPWLVAQGFRLFGIHEWAGRLPIVLCGLFAIGFAYIGAARFAGRRAGIYAALVAGTSPLFLLNSRAMLGAAPGFAFSGGAFVCFMAAVFAPAPLRSSDTVRLRAQIGWLVGGVVCAALATLSHGALVGAAPPVLGAAAAILARRELTPPWLDRRRAGFAAGVTALAVLVAGGVVFAVWADYAHFDYWTGGVPRGGNPPTWEIAIERLFHSFAPWSGLLPIALARMLVGPPPAAADAPVQAPEERAIRLGVTAWVALGFLAQTVFTARYGQTTFLPVVGAAIAVALFLRDVERSEQSWPAAALIAFLFVGLIVRDFRGFPSGPLEGLPIEGIEAPEVSLVKVLWAALLGLFALCVALGLAASERRPYKGLEEDFDRTKQAFGEAAWKAAWPIIAIGVPAALIRRQWDRGVGYRIWLVVIGVLMSLVMTFGLACWIAPDAIAVALRTTSLAIKVGRVLVFLPVGVAAVVGGSRLVLWGFAKLGSWRLAPTLVMGLAVGAFTAAYYQPDLSSHFSPREVYDTYNELASEGEPLGEYRVGGRAAAYYADGDIEELANENELVAFLAREQRVWAAFRADDLASINRAYRRQASRHLFVADARSERMILATNQPVAGRENQNYLSNAVLDEAPAIENRIQINFDDRIALLGYDLELPHDGYVGPGEAFTIVWYFQVNAPVSGAYQMFVHIDGPGQRIHGDHEPVQGRYPVRLWEPGDVVVDRQELRVPANYTRGNLTIYMGFFAGESRLEVKSGPADAENRARCGVLAIR